MIATQTKHTSEIAARVVARTLGNHYCQIVQSKEKGQLDEGPWVFYLEYGDMLDRSFIRNWEALVYEGKGKAA